MTIFPAIDLKNNQVVRLTKGLMDSATIYSDSPATQAKLFEEAGAKWLHIVDLDGAFAAEPKNKKSIQEILKTTKLKTQLGGGIRSEDTIKAYLDLGLDRVILGSSAVKDPAWAMKMAEKYPIVIGIDAKNGMVATDGWADVSEVKATDLAREFAKSSAEAIICTDISKDGTLTGVNVDFTLSIKEAFGKSVIASGGVKGLEDLNSLAKTGVIDGVIVGKAIYEGSISLKDAFNFDL